MTRTGTLPTSVASTRAEYAAVWADLTATDLWLAWLTAQTAEERDSCVWLAGLMFDELLPPPTADPSGQLWTLAEFRAGLAWARHDLNLVGTQALTDAEDSADLDDLLTDADARETAARRRRHHAWQQNRITRPART